jgi:serine/threonine protein kinase
MIQISEAIAQIHQRGIIHRDLKPENIMLLQQADNPCFVKLLDFGLARFSDNNPIHRLTQTGDIWGTTQYMSPEHLLSGKTMNGQPVSLSPASDIFSLGIIFYELLTKVTIYSSDRYQAMTEILHYTPPPPIHYNPNLPPELSLIIMRMIDKDPPVRPNANHVLEQLMQIILDLPLSECIPVLESRENQVKEAV